MILINLLPEEFIEKRVEIPIPYREIAAGLFVVFFLLSMLVWMRSQHFKKELKMMEAELTAMNPDLVRANELIKEMNQEILPRKAFLDTLDRPDNQWDRILNLISDALPDGAWLTSLTVSAIPETVIRIEGFARPLENQSAITLVGDFVSRTNQSMDDVLDEIAKYEAAPGAAAQIVQQKRAPPPVFRTETFTQQKEIGSARLTEFIVEFRKR